MRAGSLVVRIGLTFALLCPAALSAQYAAAQDSTLAGLQKVYVVFSDVNQGLGVQAAEGLKNSAILELRKAGIRVARDMSELDSNDAILNISFITYQRTFVLDVCFRMDLEQMAQLQRTKQTTRMVTWYYEKLIQNSAPVKDNAPILLTAGVNALLSKWLDMNGR